MQRGDEIILYSLTLFPKKTFFKVPITACERVPTEKCQKVKRVVCQDKLSESNRKSPKGRELAKCSSLKSCQKCSYQCSACKPLGDIRAFGQRFF